ncbi:hypothetical protein KMW28_23925 [Flammeovirga yaeyamensis]|uniref:Esterase n=1 Tax=Flammeovirga yaeyamensis TaxID=367791 RepID=A0AAX1NF18_9BACT|nr:alpha/beta hydrolase-fold protein [Flammeovirga yaeyamensis]MBB3696572.1 putative alpha/beta superfamily hydrolase [Flammeovirga yaeyamensis]NMF33250.1 hypothetical protein [Flammeovirga yaeyamensis]QWG05471.1 hypothetical protein KMW28_23925 [Flammeovirga yaeyamensis]
MRTCKLLLFLLLSYQTFSQTKTTDLVLGEKLKFPSEILSDTIECWIRVPDQFTNAQTKIDSIALLMLLDGDEYFRMSSDIAELYEWSKKMPLTIIVGLPSTGESRYKYYTPTNVKSNKSVQDSLLYAQTGHFSDYEQALKKELIPALEKLYNVKFNAKTIFGHSNGGIGALSFYTSKEKVFDKFIVASPALLWDDYYLQKQIDDQKRTESIYLTLGTNGWDYSLESYKVICEKLSKTNKNFKFQVNPQESHATNGLRSLLDGLYYVNLKGKEVQ